jgi:hypothetical protein
MNDFIHKISKRLKGLLHFPIYTVIVIIFCIIFVIIERIELIMIIKT